MNKQNDMEYMCVEWFNKNVYLQNDNNKIYKSIIIAKLITFFVNRVCILNKFKFTELEICIKVKQIKPCQKDFLACHLGHACRSFAIPDLGYYSTVNYKNNTKCFLKKLR